MPAVKLVGGVPAGRHYEPAILDIGRQGVATEIAVHGIGTGIESFGDDIACVIDVVGVVKEIPVARNMGKCVGTEYIVEK